MCLSLIFKREWKCRPSVRHHGPLKPEYPRMTLHPGMSFQLWPWQLNWPSVGCVILCELYGRAKVWSCSFLCRIGRWFGEYRCRTTLNAFKKLSSNLEIYERVVPMQAFISKRLYKDKHLRISYRAERKNAKIDYGQMNSPVKIVSNDCSLNTTRSL